MAQARAPRFPADGKATLPVPQNPAKRWSGKLQTQRADGSARRSCSRTDRQPFRLAAMCTSNRRKAESCALTSQVKSERCTQRAIRIVNGYLPQNLVFVHIRQTCRVFHHQANGKTPAAFHAHHQRAERGQRGLQTILEEVVSALRMAAAYAGCSFLMERADSAVLRQISQRFSEAVGQLVRARPLSYRKSAQD